MTTEIVTRFSTVEGIFQVEADASSGSYFVAASALLNRLGAEPKEPAARRADARTRAPGLGPVSVARWPLSNWQIDARFPELLRNHRAFKNIFSAPTSSAMSAANKSVSLDPVPISRNHDLGDSIMTAIVLAPFAAEPVTFSDLGRLRVQECERVTALRAELTKCGAKVLEERDTLTVYPSQLHGTEIETYADHRMAMCFAVVGLRVRGIRLRRPVCVKKTFPNFFQKFAALPPQGLGVTINDPFSQQALPLEDLFAD